MIGLAPCLFIENIILLGSIKLYLIGEDLRPDQRISSAAVIV